MDLSGKGLMIVVSLHCPMLKISCGELNAEGTRPDNVREAYQ